MGDLRTHSPGCCSSSPIANPTYRTVLRTSSNNVQYRQVKEAVITNRSNQHAPFGDLSHYPTLTRAQEIALADRSRAGRQAEAQLASALASGEVISARDRMALKRTIADGKEARDEFVTCNLKLAISMVGKKNIRPELRQDLIQEAAIGVQTAVEKFDPTKGFKFSTYATWWINQAISRSMQKNSRTIALPEDVDAEVRRLHNYQVDFCCEHGRDATESELAKLMGLPIDRIRKLRLWSEGTSSLDDLVRSDEGSGTRIGDIYVDVAAEDFTEKVDYRVIAELVAEELAETASLDQRSVMAERLGLTDGQGKSLDAVAKKKHLTRSQARTLEEKAVNSVRATRRVRELQSEF